MAVIKDISVLHILRCRGCCDVRIDLAKDVTVLKPRCGRTEDKVRSAFNIAVLKEQFRLSTSGIDSVLITKETAIEELYSVAFGM